MADALTTITNLINSPPGQLVAGGVLAGIVWKFFKHTGDVLNEDTTLEIALWLLSRQPISPAVQNCPTRSQMSSTSCLDSGIYPGNFFGGRAFRHTVSAFPVSS